MNVRTTATASPIFMKKTEPMIKPHHRVALVLAAMYLIALAFILFWPTPVDRPVAGTLKEAIRWAHQHGMPNSIGYNQVEFTSNIVLFVPMGYIASVWTRRPWVGIVVGAVVSCCVELSQALFLPQRYGSVLDVLANTMGAAMGAGVYHVAGRRRKIPGREPVEAPGGRAASAASASRPKAVDPGENHNKNGL